MLFSKKDAKFREAYSDYYAFVFNAVFSRIGVREDAEDICHDLFITFYNKLDEILDSRSWLLGALRYGIMNYYRKKGLREGEIDIDSYENEIAFVNGARDMRIIIQEALASNENYRDERERILYELIAINQYTYDQAGKQLGITGRQARYSYERVSNQIVDYLKKKGIANIGDLL